MYFDSFRGQNGWYTGKTGKTVHQTRHNNNKWLWKSLQFSKLRGSHSFHGKPLRKLHIFRFWCSHKTKLNPPEGPQRNHCPKNRNSKALLTGTFHNIALENYTWMIPQTYFFPFRTWFLKSTTQTKLKTLPFLSYNLNNTLDGFQNQGLGICLLFC